jgi:putative transposase
MFICFAKLTRSSVSQSFVRLIKGRSSHALRSEFPSLKRPLPTLWTNSWFCSTVGGAPLAIVKQYIENQKNR